MLPNHTWSSQEQNVLVTAEPPLQPQLPETLTRIRFHDVMSGMGFRTVEVGDGRLRRGLSEMRLRCYLLKLGYGFVENSISKFPS